MQKLTFEIKGKRTELEVPSTLAEMTGDHFLAAAKMVLSGSADDETLAILTGMPRDVLRKLDRFQRYSVEDLFSFLYRISPEDLSFKEWKLGNLCVDGTDYYGPTSNFGNVTWAEFVYVDQCMINGLHKAAVAALYRPQRKEYDGETDRRIPFTIYGTTHRFALFETVPESEILAVVLNYRAMRRAALEEKYPRIFPYHDSTPDPDEDTETQSDDIAAGFSWTQVHRALLGDRIEEEDKFLNLNVHTVLHRLDAVIEENRRRK